MSGSDEASAPLPAALSIERTYRKVNGIEFRTLSADDFEGLLAPAARVSEF